MYYDPVSPVETIFNKVEDLLEHGYMENFPFSHPQAISKAYNIINKTGKFRESFKSWDRLPLIQKMWIVFKPIFLKYHQELTKTI